MLSIIFQTSFNVHNVLMELDIFLEGYGCKRAEGPKVCEHAHGAMFLGPMREADRCVVDCRAGDLLA